MARPPLTERRKTQTRREIAETALGLFWRDGYDAVSAEAIAESSGVSLRTFYRYFPSKDEVLSPIIVAGTQELLDGIAARPDREDLATAVLRAYEETNPRQGEEGVRALITLLTSVPALHVRWLSDLREIERRLVPLVQQRASGGLGDEEAQLTAAAIVAGMRVALERTAAGAPAEPSAEAFGRALRHLGAGAGL